MQALEGIQVPLRLRQKDPAGTRRIFKKLIRSAERRWG